MRAESCRPLHVVKNLPIDEYVRGKRSCSTEEDYHHECSVIDTRLRKRGYSNRLLNRAKNIADRRSRHHLLFNDRSSENAKQSQKPKESIDNSLSLSALYTLPTPTWLQHKECYSCGRNHCRLCKYINRTDIFSSYSYESNFRVYALTNCNTTHVVYLVDCTQCMLQYIGFTIRKAKVRLSEHIAATRKTTDIRRAISGVSRHFRDVHEGDLSDMSVTITERVCKPPRGGNWPRRLQIIEVTGYIK